MMFEAIGESKMLGLRATLGHKRSKSFPDKRGVEEDHSHEAFNRKKLDMRQLKDNVETKKQSPGAEVETSLKQEILQLEKRLQDQFEVRRALEKAMGNRTFSREDTNKTSTPITKPATELIREIAVLELEVVYLEEYLLSLYRQSFDNQMSSVSPSKRNETPRERFPEVSKPETASIGREERPLDSAVHRCHSALSHRFPSRISPPEESFVDAPRAYHSQPLSMKYARDASNIISLAEHLGTRISDHVPETPNKLSEDILKCISSIYCKLADPSLSQNGLSSPNSSTSSDHYDIWSPGFKKSSSFDTRLDNPFHIEGLKEFSGPYSTMVEVPWIYRDSQKAADVESLLQNFRSLISRLEDVDPSKLNHEEKLAFWINVHNALVMHAFLAYGIPQNNVKRLFLLLKAAYNVGGHTMSIDTVQNSILGVRMSRPGQWLRLLVPSRTKFKAGDERQTYAIEHSEPLLHFALCSGSHSDPAIRVYTSKRVFQELETAKEEYIRATFGVRKDQKVLLPKLVELFAKDAGLCQAGIMEMIQQSLPESLRRAVKQWQHGKSRKNVEWIPHNFAFRYLISKELVR